MPQKILISLLIMLLVAPLNTSAAAWMAMSMGNSEQHVQHMTMPDSDHSVHMSATRGESSSHSQVSQSHEHDASDCEEHCASCTNHCSSLGIVTSTMGPLNLENHRLGAIPGTTFNRSDLPFRPPILA